ncbi:unspecific monooxygenase [Halobacteriovorax sp. BALOs_7]|uniref:Cytochrome P450 n=1 Tax=Halobacteriovorax vibrionivorans TaxID=2152716 RepID=A0ABY0ICB4_9BACT|nr:MULTISPECIES: cytochrome P450 [Halobacteriovorax]AYF44556.1 unspecific monooxygenase [Halobacteriovorax sp. BALOs_7]RZF20609.1 cytochrome P450 [Halobacteriovorax vibrionivorans]TGD47523.1 cytochrome P450 [Halobacteriovorax sp. Y22]
MTRIPSLKAYPIIGSIGELNFKECLFEQLTDRTYDLGDSFRFKLFHKDVLVVSELESFKEVIVKKRNTFLKGSTLNEIKHINKGRPSILDADGESWQKLRAELIQFFTPKILEGLYSIANNRLEKQLPLFGEKACVRDVEVLMGKLALSITSEFFIEHDFKISKEEITNPKAECDSFYYFQKFLIAELTKRMNYGPLWKYLPTISNLRFSKFIKEGKDFVRQKVEKGTENYTLITYLKDQWVDTESIIGQIYGLVGASFESTAVSLTWALYFLAQNQKLQQDLYEELKNYDLKDTKSFIDNELLQTYVDETLRLRPAFPILFREACEDAQINQDEKVIDVKKGTIVFTLLGKILNNKKVWGSDHNEFNPQRFNNLTNEQKKSYIPYSTGTRTCLGREMANIEVKIILAHLIKNFVVTPACDLSLVKPKQKFVFSSDRAIDLEFTRR